jgi:hypothetical protein
MERSWRFKKYVAELVLDHVYRSILLSEQSQPPSMLLENNFVQAFRSGNE